MRHGSRVRRECLVNDPLGHLAITTNGTHKVSDHEPPEPRHEGAPPLNAQSLDERLAALMETIRTWDWRASSVGAGLRPTDESASSVSAAATTAIAEVRADSEPVTNVASPISERLGHQLGRRSSRYPVPSPIPPYRRTRQRPPRPLCPTCPPVPSPIPPYPHTRRRLPRRLWPRRCPVPPRLDPRYLCRRRKHHTTRVRHLNRGQGAGPRPDADPLDACGHTTRSG